MICGNITYCFSTWSRRLICDMWTQSLFTVHSDLPRFTFDVKAPDTSVYLVELLAFLPGAGRTHVGWLLGQRRRRWLNSQPTWAVVCGYMLETLSDSHVADRQLEQPGPPGSGGGGLWFQGPQIPKSPNLPIYSSGPRHGKRPPPSCRCVLAQNWCSYIRYPIICVWNDLEKNTGTLSPKIAFNFVVNRASGYRS